MKSILTIIGIIIVAFILTLFIAVILRIIAEMAKLFISSRKGNNASYQCANSGEQFSYREIFFSGLGCLISCSKCIITGFKHIFTFVDGITYKNTYKKE